eukprot:2702855-Prymnesium_polylepis.1
MALLTGLPPTEIAAITEDGSPAGARSEPRPTTAPQRHGALLPASPQPERTRAGPLSGAAGPDALASHGSLLPCGPSTRVVHAHVVRARARAQPLR